MPRHYRETHTFDALLCVSHILQRALESAQEANIVQIDFNTVFDWPSHQEILRALVIMEEMGVTQFSSIGHSTLW